LFFLCQFCHYDESLTVYDNFKSPILLLHTDCDSSAKLSLWPSNAIINRRSHCHGLSQAECRYIGDTGRPASEVAPYQGPDTSGPDMVATSAATEFIMAPAKGSATLKATT
jgi:hypothetical protein